MQRLDLISGLEKMPSIPSAEKEQEFFSKMVLREDSREKINSVAGIDVAYDEAGLTGFGGVVVLDAQSLDIIETSVYRGPVQSDYIPGLFAYRELPLALRALDMLKSPPDVIMYDGHGIAHPRRFGIASHFGLVTNLPTIGCAKNHLFGLYAEPETHRGSFSYITDSDEAIGVVLRTQNSVRPVFISVGHRVSLGTCITIALRTSRSFRLPEPLRAANQLVNEERNRNNRR